jgi:short-subunit dehydrogenase
MSARSLAVITGASSGIGEKMAMGYARRGFDVVVVARRAERLAELQRTLESTCGVSVTTVAADLATAAGIDAVTAGIGDRDVDVLVNNAGAGWIGLFVDAPYERQLEIVDLNCRALVALTHRVLPRMKARGAGQIVQVASVAGFMRRRPSSSRTARPCVTSFKAPASPSPSSAPAPSPRSSSRAAA